MNDQQQKLKEKGIFLYTEKKELNNAGIVFLEWLNNKQDSEIFEDLSNCLTEIFINNAPLENRIPFDYSIKINALFDEIKPTVLRIISDFDNYIFMSFPWLSESKKHNFNIKLEFDLFINGDRQLFQQVLEFELAHYCIEDFAKKININNQCDALEDFVSNADLIETYLDALMGNLNKST